jgi:hypothetical protein
MFSLREKFLGLKAIGGFEILDNLSKDAKSLNMLVKSDLEGNLG